MSLIHNQIQTVAFYKDTSKEDKSKKLSQRLNLNIFSYEKCLAYLKESYDYHNKDNCFIVATDLSTNVGNYNYFRSEIDDLLIMKAITKSNTEFIINSTGKLVMIGADHLFCGPVDRMFDDDFDIAFWMTHRAFEPTHRLNLSMTMFLVNKDISNCEKINDFFTLRESICFSLPVNEQKWFADQKSLSLLLEKEGIVSDYFKNERKKTIYNFMGLKVKLFTYGEHYMAAVTDDGKLDLKKDTVLVDFPGQYSKEYLNRIYNQLKGGTNA